VSPPLGGLSARRKTRRKVSGFTSKRSDLENKEQSDYIFGSTLVVEKPLGGVRRYKTVACIKIYYMV
jgi:hypothetical protein